MISSLADRFKKLLVEKSWRLSKAVNFSFRLPSATGELQVPVRARLGLNLLGAPDADLLRPLERVLAFRRGTVVDVGANVGMLLKCLLEIDRRLPYLAFEPDLSCCHYLDSFIRANHLERHAVFPVGLADEQRIVELQYGDEGDVSATMMQGFRPAGMYRHRKRILVQRGDELIAQALAPGERISLIKIDAEGAENLVLAGLQRTIEQHRPFLVLEVSPYEHFLQGNIDRSYFGDAAPEELARIAQWRIDFIRQLDAYLARQRYVAMKIRRDGALERVDSVDPGKQTSFSELNYLAVPSEDLAAFAPSS